MRVRLVLVWLQGFSARQFSQQLLRLVDENGQALRANVSRAVTMHQAQQRHFLDRSFAIDTVGSR